MMPADPPIRKHPLRQSLRARLRDWHGDRRLPCTLISNWLNEFQALANTRPPLKVATFHPLPGEPDLLPLLDRHPEIEWGFPRVVGEDLVFHRISRLAELIPGAFGILEPSQDSPVMDVATVDVFLCPGLAFSPSGARLGRGKGYYDRTLARAKAGAVNIGVGLEPQWLDDLPVDPHDIPMDRVCCGSKSALVNRKQPS